MLPLKNRLKSREDFFTISKRGGFVSAGAISVKFLKNKKDNSRVGFSVGLKFSPKAIERNLIKRKLRAAISELLPRLKENADMIVMVKKVFPKISKDALQNDLENAFKKINLINQ